MNLKLMIYISLKISNIFNINAGRMKRYFLLGILQNIEN